MNKNSQNFKEVIIVEEKKEWKAPKLQVMNAKGAEGGGVGNTYEDGSYHT